MPWDAASQDGGPDRRRHIPAAVSRSTPGGGLLHAALAPRVFLRGLERLPLFL